MFCYRLSHATLTHPTTLRNINRQGVSPPSVSDHLWPRESLPQKYTRFSDFKSFCAGTFVHGLIQEACLVLNILLSILTLAMFE